ncbi:MAG: right-handed parallel beta-helix repeat-containing protein, partial [Actinobacteria bacterium]|nr:right-handed parallel beta-helix repeat-containing protein [Actinomycetota bacterium]
VCWVAFEFAQPTETMVRGARVLADFQGGIEEPLPWELRFGQRLRPGRPHPRSRPVVTTAPPAATTTAPAGQPPSSTTSTTVGTTSTTVGPPTTTQTTAVPPPASTTTTAPAGAIVVNPGSNLASLVGSNPAGTAFLIKAGTHVGQSVAPKDGNQFIGEPGAILDGNKAQFAFAGVAANVVIQGLIIEDYTNSPQLGAIHGSGSGWLVLDNEIRYNGTAGVVVPPGSLVSGNNIHHNGQIGLKAGGANVIIDGNEIAFNNYQDAFDMNWEAGGTKFVDTANLIVRNNYVHDNHGAGRDSRRQLDWRRGRQQHPHRQQRRGYGPKPGPR